jgi:ATP-binding cassette, subfamily B, multidrug efflux pump
MSKHQQKNKTFNWQILQQVFSYIKPYKRGFYTSIFLALLLAFLSPIRPFLIQLTVNSSTQAHKSMPLWIKNFTNEQLSILQLITYATIIQIVFIIIETLVRFFFTFITAWLGQQVVRDLRTKVFATILQRPLSHFDKTPIGTLTTRTINDIESINDIFSDGLIPIIADLLTILFTLITMFCIDWKLSLVALIPLPIIIVATNKFKKSVNKSFISVRNAVSQLNSFVQEHIMGMYITQSFTAEEREYNKFKKINEHHKNANIKAIFAYSVFFPVVELVLAISTALIVWWVSQLALNATDSVNFSGKIVAFVMFMNLIFRPLRILADKFNVLQMGIIAAERVLPYTKEEAINNETDKEENSTVHVFQKNEQQAIVFNNVWFAYNKDNYVLKDISFSVQMGQTLALVGSTGSGKTSIISLINKLYPIHKGSILLENKNIEQYSVEELRSKVGVVLQDVFLFSGSIIDNLTLRNPAISKQQVVEAAKLIGLHQFVMQLPNEYDYNVMERGNLLSMGQRQLMSFVRVLLYNPTILILDEATSSVDGDSEQLIQHAIDKLLVGRTSIVIAHRLSTIVKAHQIILLDKGEVKEQGTHQQLLQQNGLYSNLYQAIIKA